MPKGGSNKKRQLQEKKKAKAAAEVPDEVVSMGLCREDTPLEDAKNDQTNLPIPRVMRVLRPQAEGYNYKESAATTDESAAAKWKRNAADKADAYVNSFETTFLRGNLIDPSIMRLLGSASWDVRKALSDQLETKSYRAATPPPAGAKSKDDTNDCEFAEEEHAEEENFFMIAPTTFFESADGNGEVTPLMRCMQSACGPNIRLLLDHGADATFISKRNSRKFKEVKGLTE